MTENEISQFVFDSALAVHRALGPGLLEKAYESCLYYELDKRGLKVERQVALPLVYEKVSLKSGYIVDLIVENKVILELKSVSALAPIHSAQLLTYLRLVNLKLGLLINFNVILVNTSIKRVVNNL